MQEVKKIKKSGTEKKMIYRRQFIDTISHHIIL